MPELTLDDTERMLHLGRDAAAALSLFELVEHGAHRAISDWPVHSMMTKSRTFRAVHRLPQRVNPTLLYCRHFNNLTIRQLCSSEEQEMKAQTVAMSQPEVWTGETLKTDSSWIECFDSSDIEELDASLRQIQASGLETTAIRASDFPLPTLGARLASVRNELEGGRGFLLLRGLPIARYSPEEARILAWGIAVHLGQPVPQDGKGNLIHTVSNVGVDIRATDYGRGYQTDDELKFHNDGGDAFLLLCQRVARTGGVSKLVSVPALFGEISARRPDLAQVLQQPFHFDARMQNTLGLRVQSVPIFNLHAGKVSALYKRRLIMLAQRFPEVPRLTPHQIEALDLLDELCEDPKFHLSFSMEPGDVQMGNNYAVLHSRTKYEDYPEPERKRSLVRIWLSLPNGRPLPEVFSTTREFGASYALRSTGSASSRSVGNLSA